MKISYYNHDNKIKLSNRDLNKIKRMLNSSIKYFKNIGINIEEQHIKLIFSKAKLQLRLIKRLDKLPQMMTENCEILINSSAIKNKEVFYTLLKHEIVHILLNLINTNIPYWVSEGLACYLSGQTFFCNFSQLQTLDKLKNSFDNCIIDYYSALQYVKYIIENNSSVLKELIRGAIDIEISIEEVILNNLK